MADIFISYKREDRELVRKLVRALQKRGFTVWWDNRLEWGDNWMRCIKRALDAAACTVVVWTPKSVTPNGEYRSDVVAAEATAAHSRHALLPVRIGEVTRPFPHNILQEEDLSNWPGNADDTAFIRVTARLETLCGGRSLESDEIAAWLKAEDANNAEAFREFARAFPGSRYASEAEPRAAECDIRSADVALARDAANGIVERFAREVRKPELAPPIGLQRVTKEISPLSRSELFESLKGGAKAMLQAAPGGGKSTALLDLARAYPDSGAESIGVYLRLKDLFSQGDDILSHLERLEVGRLISESAWQELARSGCLAVFCDGWNELNAAERDKVGSVLDLFALSYPMAGLVVGTRPLAPPPLRGEHLLITLQSLTPEQIREIVRDRVGANSEAALAELRRSPSLLELVRNPFFLAAFCATRSAGSQATTRESLIAGMLEALAAKPEHAKPLRDVLGWHHERYLTALAVEMLNEETAELGGDRARIVVNGISSELEAEGIETQRVKGDTVLEVLRDHHCLIERGSSKLSYQFQHQLISEWYAAQEVRRLASLALSDDGAREALDQILNRRAWTEALLFAAERPAEGDGADATAHMILRVMGIDPDLAGEMIAVAPDAVWKKIAPSIKNFVDNWLPVSKARALRFIMKSGKGDFADALWSAIREERDHHAAQALQDHRFDHPQVLGPYWKARTADLDPRGRRSVLVMLASNSGIDGAKMALESALASREAEVEAELADTLSFYRFDEQLAELLAGMTDEGWELLVQIDHIDDLWCTPWREKAAIAAQRALQKMEAGAARLRFALLLKDKGEPVGIDVVSELLALKFEHGSDGYGFFEKVAALEPDRLSDALFGQILDGRPLLYGTSRFVKPTAAVDRERLLDICRAGGRHREIEVLAPLLDANSVRQLFPQHLDIETRYRAADVHARKEIEGQREELSSALYHADRNVLAAVILEHEPASSGEIGRIADLMMRAFGDQFGRDRRAPLSPELRGKIVALLEKWAGRIVADPEASRHALHALAEAMGTFPDAKLLVPLRSLIQAELERWRKEKAEFKAAHERGKILQDSGARMSYEHRYGQNMLSLTTGSNPDVVSDENDKNPPPRRNWWTRSSMR
jgi:TIR domain